MTNNNIRAGWDTERSRAGAFSGSYQTLGSPTTQNPVIMICDNQSTVDIELSMDGVNTWKTFSAGEALVLDCRGNHGIASNFTMDIGTQLYVKGTGGTGSFRVSIIYAR